MIVVNGDNAIQGNTVLKPEYVPSIEKQNLKKKPKDIKSKQNRVKSKIKIIRNISLAFVIGITLIGRYSIIYNMQKELNSIKYNINEISKENENLKVELVKYNNLQYIEQVAIKKLNMLPPDKGSAVYTDLDKKYIKSSEKKAENKVQKNIFDKLTKILF